MEGSSVLGRLGVALRFWGVSGFRVSGSGFRGVAGLRVVTPHRF